MSFSRLIGFVAPLMLVLPFTAQAAWPEGVRDTYMQECLVTAQATVGAEQAKTHCECAADVIGEEFSEAEINALNDPQKPAPMELQNRLVEAVGTCNS